MRYAIVNTYDCFNHEGKIFKPESYSLSQDLNDYAVKLRDKLADKGIELTTPDVYDDYDGYIFVDYPNMPLYKLQELAGSGKKLYLILFENPMIMPQNYNRHNHEPFSKVFTWASIDKDPKYVNVPIPQKLQGEVLNLPKEKLISIACFNKQGLHPLELYSERKRAIDYFTEFYRPDFDLYGAGWDEHPAFKGYVKNKRETIGKYKFNICYENMYGMNGYITEKIFDAIFSGTLPIYYGDPRARHIFPKDSVLYRDDFVDYSDMGTCISTMPDDEYKSRLDKLKECVKGPDIQAFSSDTFANIVVKYVSD